MESTGELLIYKYDNNVMEPFAVHIESQIEVSNKKRKHLDEEDREDNNERIAIERNLSPKQIDTLNSSFKKQKNKGKVPHTNVIQARSHTSKLSQDECFDLENKIDEHWESNHYTNNMTKETSILLYKAEGTILE